MVSGVYAAGNVSDLTAQVVMAVAGGGPRPQPRSTGTCWACSTEGLLEAEQNVSKENHVATERPYVGEAQTRTMPDPTRDY